MVNIKDIAQEILDIAKKNGCSAQVSVSEGKEKEINVREAVIEQLLSNVSLSTGVRLFKGKKSSIISFSGNNFDNLEDKVKQALESLQYLGEDEATRLLEAHEFSGDGKAVDIDDDAYDQIDNPAIFETLKTIEKNGLAVSPAVTPADMASFSAYSSRMHVYSTEGLAKSYSRSMYSFYYSAVAEKDGNKEVDSWFEQKRYFESLTPKMVEDIGTIAAQRAVKRLGGRKIKSGEMPVIFTPSTASTILGLLADGLDGEEVLLKNSFLVGKMGETLFGPNITIVDDPLIDRYPGSYPFDGEGVNSFRKLAVDKGKINCFLHNSYSAGKLGMELTGNASRTISSAPGIKCGNFYLEPGKGNMDDLVHEMKDGLVVEDMFTSGMNNVTGNFSFGCSGFLVEGGVITTPVKEITIAGNIVDVYKDIIAIADDNMHKGGLCSPSILVSKLAIAGT